MQFKKILLISIYLLYVSSSYGKTFVDIQWLGGPTMKISFNGITFLTDPMLGEGEKAFLMGDPNEPFDLNKGPRIKHHSRLNPLPKVNLTNTSFVLLSHAHEDHFDQVAHKTLSKDIKIILPQADETKIRQLGFQQLNPLLASDSIDLQAGDGKITITAIPADHSTNSALTPLLGEGLGYLMQFTLGHWSKTIYWTGDSMPTDRVIKAVKNQGKVDVLIPNMGAVGTSGPLGQISMGADDALFLAKALNVKNIFPIHHSTYALYLEPIANLHKSKQANDLTIANIIEGESVRFP